MTNYFLPLALLFIFSAGAFAQSGKLNKRNERALDEAKARMTSLVATVYTDSSETARFTACRDLIKELVTALDRPNSFNYDFGEVPGLSVQYPTDRSFRIFTWELFVNRDEYHHYGAIQQNEKQLVLTPLLDRGDSWRENPENAIVAADDWLGYAVYDIVDAGAYQGKPYYFLLGYDSYETYRRRKIVDVLRFDEGGQPVFGLPIFDTYNEADMLLADRARIILEYSAEATVALRYDPEFDGLVYENLIMIPGSYDEGPVNMPDGSYHSLKLGQDGRWREAEQFTHKYKEAPREVPIPDGGRDLLGRKRGGGSGGGKR